MNVQPPWETSWLEPGEAGSHVFVADDLDLLAVDVANPAQPFVVALYQKTPLAYGVALAGDYAYVADHDWGLRIVDAADPASLSEVGFYDSPGNALDVAVRGDYAYLATHNSGLRVIRVSDPAHPAEVGAYDPDAGQAFRLVLAGDYAYLADYDHNSLRIIDVSNPANPFPAGSYAAPLPVKAVAVSETLLGGRRYAYLAEYEQKTMGSDSYLRVVDVTDPAHPASVGVLHNLAGAAFDLAVVEGAGGTRYVYLADGYLNVIDVTDPTSPTQTLMMPAGYDRTYEGVAVAGKRAYFAYGNGGLTVWDITDPALPTQLVVTDTPLNARDVAVREDAVMIAAWTGGLVAFAETELRVAPAAITWLAEVGGDDPRPRTVQIESSGRPLAWTATISPTVGWLEVAPLSGATPGEVTLAAHIADLGVGRLEVQLLVDAGEGIVGSPRTIPVTLIVAERVFGSYLPLVLRSAGN